MHKTIAGGSTDRRDARAIPLDGGRHNPNGYFGLQVLKSWRADCRPSRVLRLASMDNSALAVAVLAGA